ncbi:MAG: glycosyltransferase family 4 protein [Selenomonadaceae bacterium]
MAHDGKRGIYALAPIDGWNDVQLTKNTGILPFLFHKMFGFRAVMVGTKNADYTMARFVPGLELDFLPDASEATKIKYIEQHKDDIDVLLLHGPYESYHPVVSAYRDMRPDGKVYLELDLNSYSADRVDCTSESFKRFISQCDVIAASCGRVQQFVASRWPCVVDCLMNGFYNFSGAPLLPIDAYDETYHERQNAILTVGRIGHPEKRNDILLEAFAAIADYVNDFSVRLIGPVDGEFQEWLERDFFTRYPHLRGRVELTGAIYDKAALYREYRKAKIFVISSPLEGGMPNVAAEALFGGCAMVTSDIDAAPEMTNGGRCGDVFPCGDSAALSEILRDICTDEEKIKSFGREAIRYAHERLDFENIARHAYYLLYGEVPR